MFALLECRASARSLPHTYSSLRVEAFRVVSVSLRVRRRIRTIAIPSRQQVMGTKTVSFETSSHSTRIDGPRIGKLSCKGRNNITTPDYFALSSRGAIQHLSQDTVRDHTNFKAMYTALEEFIERAAEKTPPILQMPVEARESRLRKFIAFQDDPILILGPRRIPPLPCAAANTHYAISIVTSVGFATLESTQYAEAVQELMPDIVFGMADVADNKPGVKRLEKMGDRTQSWLRDLVTALKADEEGKSDISIFAPILPVEAEQQSYYLEALEEEFSEDISGLILHDSSSVVSIPKTLSHLPRVLIANSPSPHKLLDAIAVGVDLFTVPFVGAATDAGIALDFSFPTQKPDSSAKLLPLGLDMWSTAYAIDTSPIRVACDCYTCSNHHKAYLQHLFSAKEMLGWTLLQIHNHRVMDSFFAGVRQSIQQETFDKDVEVFARTYEYELPEKTGQGPRIRGYQYKSEGKGEPPINPLAYRPLDDGEEKLAEAALPSPDIRALDLEKQGFAAKVD